jgi:putative ABC transport system permease protein
MACRPCRPGWSPPSPSTPPARPNRSTGAWYRSPPDPSRGLNALTLRRGRWPEPGRAGEVLVSEAFAEARALRPGDRLDAVIDGRRTALVVTGVVLSPEYVYEIRPGDLFPDNRRFGVLWMGADDLSAALDMKGAFNDLSLALRPEAREADVLARLDLLLAPYGGAGAHGRENQQSHRMVTDEISQMRVMAIIPPAIFLSVSAFLLNVVLSRLVHTQREQIAMLKAFGYGPGEIALHYFKMVAGVVAAAMAVGSLVGRWLGEDMSRMYARFFRFPDFAFHMPPELPLFACGLCLLAAVVGVAGAVRAAARLPPAEAMRPEPPADFRPSLLERMGLDRLLGPAGRMVLRNLERRPLRAFFAVVGVALATAVLVIGSFIRGTLDYLMDFQFQNAQRQDYLLALTEPAGNPVLHDLARLPGVRQVEPVRAVPIRMRHGNLERRLSLTGVEPRRDLFPLLTPGLRPARLPAQGLLLSAALAEALEIEPGDSVTVEVLDGTRPVRSLPVAALLHDYAGINAYLDRAALGRLLGEPETWSAAFVTVDAARSAEFVREVKQTPAIAAATSKEAALFSFRNTFAENILRMRIVNVTFAVIIAFGVVYNTARIAFSERSRELATLRVIGFTRAEISAILLGEVGVQVLLGILPGLALGTTFAWLAVVYMATESQRIPLIVTSETYAFSALVVALAALFSGLVVRRGLDRLDLVSVLKARD